MGTNLEHIITPEMAGTLAGLFRERVRRTPDNAAYQYFNPAEEKWHIITWAKMATEVARWRTALAKEELKTGDRVALMLRNCQEWVSFDQAALDLGLVIVPLYINDRPDNIRYILKNSGAKVLFLENFLQWEELKRWRGLRQLVRIISLYPVDEENRTLKHLCYLQEWLPTTAEEGPSVPVSSADLATIVYTSGTTGPPKGVMLSHHNILWNAYSGLQGTPIYPDDSFLSFLPLSHALERTVGYYLPMMAGSSVAYARSIPKLAEDLITIKPTALVSVPRIFERIRNKIHSELQERTPLERALFKLTVTAGWHSFSHQQGHAAWHPLSLLTPMLQPLVGRRIRAQLGGRLRVIVCGGAPLAFDVARELLALGLPLIQGYGLTEAGPVVSGNSLHNNNPKSVGPPLPGIEVRIGANQELLVRGPSVMLGYWNNSKATAKVIDAEGWLHTGDQAHIKDGRIFITGRIKEIIVLANGEKVPPGEMEAAIAVDPLFEQVMVIGEGKPYLSALIVLSLECWEDLARHFDLNPNQEESLKHRAVLEHVLERIEEHTHHFPGYARIRQVTLIREHWTVDNGLATATLKPRRKQVLQHYHTEISALYEGH
jgi:long-chain acyl-CoA synthetase